MYKITAEEDGQTTWTRQYQDCVSAVHDFDRFKDCGEARFERVITLTEPSGQQVVKIFTAYAPV